MWDSEFNKWPKHTHDLHVKLYGTKEYDREKLKIAYDRHSQEVKEYFKDRTEDLLVMEVGEGAWEALCNFLGKDKPSIPFPHRNSRKCIGDGWDLKVDPISEA